MENPCRSEKMHPAQNVKKNTFTLKTLNSTVSKINWVRDLYLYYYPRDQLYSIKMNL